MKKYRSNSLCILNLKLGPQTQIPTGVSLVTKWVTSRVDSMVTRRGPVISGWWGSAAPDNADEEEWAILSKSGKLNKIYPEGENVYFYMAFSDY